MRGQIDTPGANGTEKDAPRGGRTFVVTFVCMAGAAAVMMAGELLDIGYYLTSVVAIVLAMIPFLASFEGRRPQARELVVVAVLVAIAVASRAAFMWLPSFKPLVGIVMVAGIALGAQTGFLTGAMAAFVSNFIFGQGPWTPWQMFAFGIAGFVAGLLAKRGFIPRGGWTMRQRFGISAFGFALLVCVVGPILDTCSLFTMVSTPSPSGAAAIYLSGFPFNVVHGVATALTLFLVGNPMLDKLERIRVKYGMME